MIPKLFGIYVDTHLNFKAHIYLLCKHLNKVCFSMRCLADVTNLETRLTVYNSYFLSLVCYGILVWGPSKHLDRVLVVQKKVIRAMLGVPTGTSCRQYFRKLNILTVPSLFIFETIKHVAGNMEDYVQWKATHQHNTRNQNLLIYPRHRTSFRESSPDYMGIKLYNKLPEYFRIAIPLSSGWAGELKQLLIGRAYYSVAEYLQDDAL